MARIKKEKKKGCCGNFLWLIIVLGLLGAFTSDNDESNDNSHVNEVVTEASEINTVETIETEALTKENSIDQLKSSFSEHIESDRVDLLFTILFEEIGFDEVEFIKKVDGTFNYEVWLNGIKGIVTDTGDGFRVFIPDTGTVFYEDGSVVTNAETFESKKINHNDVSSYYSIAKMIIEDNLKNPSSAKFPSLLTNSSEIGMSKSGDLICVQSYVDATNSFGAKVRTNWIVQFTVINLNSFSYELNYIKIGDESAGEFISMK